MNAVCCPTLGIGGRRLRLTVRQTGNSGAIPGRPRRCKRATFELTISLPLSPAKRQVMRRPGQFGRASQKTYQYSQQRSSRDGDCPSFWHIPTACRALALAMRPAASIVMPELPRWSAERRRLWLSLVISVTLHALAMGFAIAFMRGMDNSKARMLPVDSGRAAIEALHAQASTTHDKITNAAQALPMAIDSLVDDRHLAAPTTHIVARRAVIECPIASDPLPDVPYALEQSELAMPAPPGELARGTNATTESAAIAASPQPAGERHSRTPEVDAVPHEVTSVASVGSQASQGADDEPSVRPVFNPAPAYPIDALRLRQSGRVVLRVAIDAQGKVTNLHITSSSGVASLDAAAVAAVRNWRFLPALRNGQPVPTIVGVPVRFALAN